MIKLQNNHRCLHDFTPIIEGNETVGLICIIDGCGFSVREDMQRSDYQIDANGSLFQNKISFNSDSHCGQRGGGF